VQQQSPADGEIRVKFQHNRLTATRENQFLKRLACGYALSVHSFNQHPFLFNE
jgi:hypothetical protein